ncbi:Arachidonate 12-lipoxygenase, 12R-type [Bulinus truncatus]|nr:Arachidonate 12-lipoxygenase, 12R-type [Bulinus truncatus]
MFAYTGIRECDYIVDIKTGDSLGAGTNANVWIILYDENSNATPPIKLTDSRVLTTNLNEALPTFSRFCKSDTSNLKKDDIGQELPLEEQFSFIDQFRLQILTFNLRACNKYLNFTHGDWTSIKDIFTIYSSPCFPIPERSSLWTDDYYFGRQRVASLNPSVIQLVTKLPQKLPVTDELVKQFMGGLTLQEAINQKRLFICDLQILEGIPVKKDFVLCAPIALFFVGISGQLKPVAIQLFQKPGPKNPIFTPRSPSLTWTLVKMWFNNADCAYHQALTHLGFTHLLMESFSLATQRNLSHSHPVYKILEPHFLYIMAINSLAVTQLVNDGGWVDMTMNYGNKGMYALIVKAYKDWRLDVDGTLPEELKRRGVDNPDVLPGYHYRDDAMLLYNAINKYVHDYLKLYYTSPELVSNDHELQSWAQELVKERNFDKGGMGIKGIPGNGKLSTVEQIQQIVTSVIFICSVGHAATNFPQYDEYAFPPVYPATLFGKPPTDPKATVTEQDILKCLPNKEMTLEIMTMTKILSTKGTKSLGDFEVEYIVDPKAVAVVKSFRENISKIKKPVQDLSQFNMFSYFGLLECDYIVEIKTGDSLGAGTNANVWIILYDENSNATPSIDLDQLLKDNFERGSTDVFQISKSDTSNLKKDGQVAKIEFWRDDHGNSSDYFTQNKTF